MENVKDFYDDGNYRKLGIVPTPKHIAEFMVDLLEVNDQDVVLDTCLGIGGLVADERIKNVVGVELQPKLAEIAAELLKNKNLELIVGDGWNPEVIQQINAQKPTKLIINPPYGEAEYHELGFLKLGLDSLQPGGLGVIIIPTGVAIKTDKKTKQLKKEILEKHSLVATFSMPEQLFYPVGAITTVMLFRAHEPHSKETFFGNLKNDGFELTKKEGRVDTKGLWRGIKQEVLDLYKNRKAENGKSAVELVTFDVEWATEAHIKSGILIDREDFLRNLKLFIIFKAGIFKEAKENLIDDVLDFLKDKPDIRDPFSNDDIKIEDVEWRDFSVVNYFNVVNGRGGTKKAAKEKEGGNFYISATKENNGLSLLTGEATKHKGNVLTVSAFCDCFYQSEPFLGSGIVVLEPKFKMNAYHALFVASLINLQRENYSYGRQLGVARAKELKISLPVDSSGNPDWQLIEDYIKSLPYSKHLQ